MLPQQRYCLYDVICVSVPDADLLPMTTTKRHSSARGEAPMYSLSSLPTPPTFPAALAKNTAVAPETGASYLLSPPRAEKTAMAPETQIDAPDLSSPVIPSSPDREHSSCESTAVCSVAITTTPPAPTALQSDSEPSELFRRG